MHSSGVNPSDYSFDLQNAIDNEPLLFGYREYLRLLEQGLRPAALRQLELCLEGLRPLEPKVQRSLVSLLVRFSEQKLGYWRRPYPLFEGFIDPLLETWRGELPDDPEPLRLSNALVHIAQSLMLDPSCMYTRRKLIRSALEYLDYSTHELPYGYLGNIVKDLELIALIRKESRLLPDEVSIAKSIEIIDKLSSKMRTYFESRKNNSADSE